MRETLLKLTTIDGSIVLIGVESIIEVTDYLFDKHRIVGSKIKSRGAMIETNYVVESPNKIYDMYTKSIQP